MRPIEQGRLSRTTLLPHPGRTWGKPAEAMRLTRRRIGAGVSLSFACLHLVGVFAKRVPNRVPSFAHVSVLTALRGSTCPLFSCMAPWTHRIPLVGCGHVDVLVPIGEPRRALRRTDAGGLVRRQKLQDRVAQLSVALPGMARESDFRRNPRLLGASSDPRPELLDHLRNPDSDFWVGMLRSRIASS